MSEFYGLIGLVALLITIGVVALIGDWIEHRGEK